jgi:hypothetical protein
VAPAAEPTDETFQYRLSDGAIITVGKPRGILKLRLRNLLTLDELKDQELVFMAQAMLSIRSIKSADGGLQPPTCNNRLQFEALLARFGEDKYLEEFMAHYQKLVNPGIAEVLEKALADAQEQGIVDDEALKTFLQTRMLEYQREQLASVKN